MAPSPTKLTTEELKRKILFVPCETKAALHKWIRLFLDLDLPDSLVDPESDCTPMGMVWECYTKMLRNDDPEFNRVLYFSGRECGKTLAEAVIEVMCLTHLQRDVVHLAAIEAQSRKAQEYVRGFMSRPFLREFLVSDNQREIMVRRYYDEAKDETLSPDEFAELPAGEKQRFQMIQNYARIIVATIQSTNGQHSSVMCLDEIDIIKDKKAYEEAQLVPSEGKGGKRALTILTSTRKVSFGLVQKEIDNARESGLIWRHWNILDVTEKCPESRHKPELPRLPIYRSAELLKHVTEDGYQNLAEDSKGKYVLDQDAFAGCATCKLYPACRGLLATKQQSVKAENSFVKSIDHAIKAFRAVSLNTAKAQLLCWKPSTDGLIYPQLDREVHMLTPAEMAEKITGEKQRHDFTKAELLYLMRASDLKWHAGMDFGYTHDFAVVAGATDGYRAFVVEVISQSELDDEQKLVACDKQIKVLKPSIWPDTAYPGTIATFRKKGYRMRDWNKGPESVNAGIETVRMMLRPSVGEPRLYFLKDDEGCELLVKRLGQYHWKLEADGRIGKDPDKELDDLCDSIRYWLMNGFGAGKGNVRVGRDEPSSNMNSQPPGSFSDAAPGQLPLDNSWFDEIKREHGILDNNNEEVSITQGSFKFKM